MKRIIFLCFLLPVFTPFVYSQDTASTTFLVDKYAVEFSKFKLESFRKEDDQPFVSPYKTSFKVDGPIIAAGVGLTAFGTYLISKKKALTDAELAGKKKSNLPFFDRGNAGFYSEKADRDSYIPFDVSFAMPVALLLLNKNERHKPVQVLALYIETMAVTGTLFTMATGTVYRSRPYVYGDIASVERKKDNDSQRSFYAGHTAATAAASFYAAKVFQDFNPNSKARIWVWGLAAAIPATVGYLRYKAGMHFLSDNLLGYVLGAGAGILIPEWHKSKKMKNMSFSPQVGNNYKGIAYTYRF